MSVEAGLIGLLSGQPMLASPAVVAKQLSADLQPSVACPEKATGMLSFRFELLLYLFRLLLSPTGGRSPSGAGGKVWAAKLDAYCAGETYRRSQAASAI